MNTSRKMDVNVDPMELKKFDDMASRWWDPDGEFKPLHKINPVRVNYVAERSKLDACQALDVGCGGGLLSEGFAFKGAQVTGIDMAAGPLNVARLHQKKSSLESIRYLETTAESLAENEAASFDVVTCMEVIEHVPNPASLVAACAQLAKPGADVFFSTINRNPKAFMMAIVGAEYIMRMLPKGTHEYERFIKPSELRYWGHLAKLEFVDIAGIVYSPLSDEFSLGDDVAVNYLMHFTAPA